MAYVGGIQFGDIGMNSGAAGTGFTNVTVDATDDGWAFAFQALSTDPITHLGFRYGVRTGTPPTFSIRLESLDGSGLPDNTDVGGGSATAVTFTPPADTTWNGIWKWQTLTNPYTPSVGQVLVATIRYSSGTINAGNHSTFGRQFTPLVPSLLTIPYALDLAGGSWTKRQGPLGGWRTASGRYGLIAESTYSTATANTAGHRNASCWTMPTGVCTSYKISGVSFFGKPGAAAGSCKVGVWDSSWSELQAVTIDSDQLGATSTNTPHRVYFTSTTALTPGTKYYIGLEVVSGSVNVNGITVGAAEDRSAFPNGLNRANVTWDGSTTTETTTIVPQILPVIGDLTGGGGAVLLPQQGYTGIGVY